MNQLLLPRGDQQAARHQSASRRVLHLINGEHYSGAERVQDLLGSALSPLGYDVGYACVKPGRFATERNSQNNHLFSLRMKWKFDLRCIAPAVRIVQQRGYQILHAHTPRTLLIGTLLARRCKLPLVYHVHSPVGRDSHRPIQNLVNQRVETWCARRADRLICVSDSLGSYMLRLGHERSRLSVVPNGVRIVKHLPKRQSPRGTWTIGTTALFRPRKGTEVLLDALGQLLAKGRNVRLLAVGPFENIAYEKQLKERADRLGIRDHVTWTGFQSDVNQFFQQMDVFVLPSLFGEGLPMVVLEAMANGVPVVAADVEGIPQAIRHQRDGLIFPAGDAAQLHLALQSLIAGACDWNALRDSALRRQRKRFSDESMARGVADVYDELVKR